MKPQRLLIGLTVVNVDPLMLSLVRSRPEIEAQRDVVSVLRGRALEIVDDRGKVPGSQIGVTVGHDRGPGEDACYR